eukprot:scaffold131696_cov48-Phaeocystis_antarctica.AAC.1
MPRPAWRRGGRNRQTDRIKRSGIERTWYSKQTSRWTHVTRTVFCSREPFVFEDCILEALGKRRVDARAVRREHLRLGLGLELGYLLADE